MGLRGGEVEAEVLDRAPPVPGTALPEGLAGCGASTTRSHFATHIGPICRVEMKPVSLAAPDAPVASQPFAILSKTRGQKNFQLFSQTVEIPGGHLHFLPRLLGVTALREGPRVHASRVGARTRSPFLCSLSSSPFLPIGSEGGISFFSASSFAVVRPSALRGTARRESPFMSITRIFISFSGCPCSSDCPSHLPFTSRGSFSQKFFWKFF